MPNEYAVIILAVAALLTGGLYLMTRRRRKKKKSAPPVRPAAPVNQTAGVAATWAPPAPARPAPVAPTMVAPPPGAAVGRACGAAARGRARVGPTGVSDSALVESARGSLVGRRAACSSRARGTSPGTPRLDRLGGAAGVRRRAAGDRGAVVGHSQDRGTGGPARPFVGSASAAATCLGRAFGARPCAVPATGRSPATATERRPGARLVGSRRG